MLIGDKGSASFAFSLRGVIDVPAVQEEKELNEESALELAVEAGAEEVEEALDDEDTPVFQVS